MTCDKEEEMQIDISKIPEETGKRFGQCILDGLREFLKQPGAREALEARTRARQERRRTLEAALQEG